MKKVFLLSLLALTLVSCRTIEGVYIPEVTTSQTASYDGGELNSGILSELSDGSGFVVTAHFVDRYNALIKKYGEKFTPRLHQGDGVSPLLDGQFGIDNEHMSKFLTMNQWNRSGIEP